MAASAPPVSNACEAAVRALLEARWADWHGLPGDCTLAGLDKAFGGTSVLDDETLGRDRTSCTRSSANEVPLLVWHRDQEVLLIECELPASAAAPPAGIVRHRLDVWWGAAHLDGGEWVIPERGLALIATDEGRVVSCLGFAPTNFDRYVAALRPHRAAPVPLPPPSAPRQNKGSDR